MWQYPFNETYTTLIPALIMGNCVILKTPRPGVLVSALAALPSPPPPPPHGRLSAALGLLSSPPPPSTPASAEPAQCGALMAASTRSATWQHWRFSQR
jgi:hypothetical protein